MFGTKARERRLLEQIAEARNESYRRSVRLSANADTIKSLREELEYQTRSAREWESMYRDLYEQHKKLRAEGNEEWRARYRELWEKYRAHLVSHTRMLKYLHGNQEDAA